MSQEIKTNDINDTTDDNIVLQYLKDYKAVKCLYCLQDDKKFLCQCKDCKYYFCNNIHRKTSHIVIHLKQCKHQKVSLNPFDEELACEKCRNKDIFQLCFKDKKILCESCVEENEDEEGEFKRIIADIKIDNDILMCPDVPPVANRFDSYSESLFTRMNQKIIKLKDLMIDTASVNYTNKKDYCLRYKNLLEIEQKYVEEEEEAEDFFKYELKFSDNLNYITAEIKRDNQDFYFYNRQFLIVAKATNPHKTSLAKVINIDKNQNSVTIYFEDLDKLMNNGVYLIKEHETSNSNDRMIEGLEKLKKSNNLLDEDILELIIANNKNEDEEEEKDKKEQFSNENKFVDKSRLPKNLNISKLENNILNKSQENAIKNCFNNKLTLIRGPPGTGKTKVLSMIAYHLIQLEKFSNGKLFIGAPSNRAVDNISYYLQKLELPFVRVLSSEKETLEDLDLTNSLDKLVNKIIEEKLPKSNPKKYKEFKELYETKFKYGRLKKEDNKKYYEIINEYQEEILRKTPIIIATINNSADSRIEGFEFPVVILDEAAQALEPDCLLPLYHQAKMVVLIGDEKQLGPTVKSQDASMAGLGISLFERLCFYYKGSNFISTLTEQYRMHKSLYEFSNKHFYDNQIVTHGEIELDERVKNSFPWPNKDVPTFFYNSIEPEKSENSSYYNDKEMYKVYAVVHNLNKAGVQMKDIGIITPYSVQKLKLQFEKFYSDRFKDLKIESVDGFQGMEKEYIIISSVRSNIYGKIGFLTSTKRLNVSLTRAKRGLIIIGNYECLSKRNGIWRDLVKFYHSKKLIVEGKLFDLKPIEDEDFIFEEIPEDEEIKEEKEDFEGEQKGKCLNLSKEASMDLAWRMSPAPIEGDFEEDEKDEKEEDKNEIIGLNKKNKKNKNKNKTGNKKGSDDEKDEDEEDEKNKKKNKKGNKEIIMKNEIHDEKEEDKKNKKNKKEKNEKNQKNKIEDEKEEKKNKKKDNKKDKEDSDSEENKKGKKSKKKGKK